MNVAGGDKRMDARAPGILERIGRSQDVPAIRARQCRDAHPGELARHRVHCFGVALRGNRESRFQDVHAQFHQLRRHAELLRNGHATAGRLLPVTQRGVEDVDPIGHVLKPPYCHYHGRPRIWQINNILTLYNVPLWKCIPCACS
jgi:hypothetical protein